jgi:TfoX/Sxy family transcriptional regulator of competence genes
MAYDEALAQEARDILGSRAGLKEKKMFGGVAFMLNGHMCCGVVGRDLMVRVGPEQHDQALAEPHARPMDFTGRPMKGFIYVGPEGWRSAASLRKWINRGVSFAKSLPPK